MNKYLCHIIGLLFLTACGAHQEDKIPVAKVHDAILYYADIDELLPSQLSKEDSLLFVKSYINKWANQQLLLHKANINLREEKVHINALVDQYKQDLLINKYKEAVVKQELDTVVTEQQIDSFYTKNKEIFRLNEELLKFRYIHFGKDILNPKEFISLFRSDKYSADTKLMEQELQLKSYNLNDSIWIKYDDVIKKAAFLKRYQKKQLLRKSFFQTDDDEGVYLVSVKDVLLRNQIAPKSYALPTIKQMVLHRRKLELLRKIEETLIEDAIKNEEFKIYE